MNACIRYNDVTFASKQFFSFDIPLYPMRGTFDVLIPVFHLSYKHIYIAVIPKDVTCLDMTVAVALNGVHIKSLFDDINIGEIYNLVFLYGICILYIPYNRYSILFTSNG